MADMHTVQPNIPGHTITVPAAAGAPPYCSCGVVGGNGRNAPLLADHIKALGGYRPAFPILPPDRTWPTPVEEIAHHIANRLGGAPESDAALYLLMRCPGQPWARENVAAAASFGWGWFAGVLDQHATDEQRATVDLATALAGHGHDHLDDLGAVLRGLDQKTREAFIDAVRMLGGAR